MVSAVTSASNTAASVTLEKQPGTRARITHLAWSYSGTPAGGITITGLDGDTFTVDITSGGPGALLFPKNFLGRVNTDVVVTIAAGGAVVGKLNVTWERE